MAYEVVVTHEGLHKYRVVRGATAWEAETKADAQARAWDEQWQRKVSANKRRDERHQAMEYKESRKADAQRITAEAEALREELQGILAQSLRVKNAMDWDEFLDKRGFAEPQPQQPPMPHLPLKPEPRPPERMAKKPGLFRRFLEAVDSEYTEERLELEEEEYQARVADAKRAYEAKLQRYNEELKARAAAHQAWQSTLAAWETRRKEFLAAQQAHNQQVAQFARRYQQADPAIVQEYCERVLQRSRYPDLFPGDFDVKFLPQEGIVLVDFVLPTPDTIPSVKSARYVAGRDATEETDYKPREKTRLYEQVVYQTALRTIHELYEADRAMALRAVVFNGRTHSVNPATGKDANACLLSVRADREVFLQIDLSRIDPEKCIRGLGGVVSANMGELLPVAPITHVGDLAPRPTESREPITKTTEEPGTVTFEGPPSPGASLSLEVAPIAEGPTSISCPNCGVSFPLSPELRGKQVKCGSCNRKFHAPW